LTPKTDMAKKDDDDAVAAAIMHLYRVAKKTGTLFSTPYNFIKY